MIREIKILLRENNEAMLIKRGHFVENIIFQENRKIKARSKLLVSTFFGS